MPFRRQLRDTPSAAFVTLRFPQQLHRLGAATAIDRLSSIAEIEDTAGDLSFDDLIGQSTNILKDIGQFVNGLVAIQGGETIPGHNFQTMLDLITRSMATVTKLQLLALPLRLEQNDDKEEESQNGRKSQQADKGYIVISDNDGNWNGEDEIEVEIIAEHVDTTNHLNQPEDKDLATAPSYAEWTSAQMLLHAAELRFHAWDIGMDRLTVKATACKREATEWEAEGQRRKDLEHAGEREAWDWGCTNHHIERPWDWRLQQAVEQAERPEIPFLAKNEYDT